MESREKTNIVSFHENKREPEKKQGKKSLGNIKRFILKYFISMYVKLNRNLLTPNTKSRGVDCSIIERYESFLHGERLLHKASVH